MGHNVYRQNVSCDKMSNVNNVIHYEILHSSFLLKCFNNLYIIIITKLVPCYTHTVQLFYTQTTDHDSSPLGLEQCYQRGAICLNVHMSIYFHMSVCPHVHMSMCPHVHMSRPWTYGRVNMWTHGHNEEGQQQLWLENFVIICFVCFIPIFVIRFVLLYILLLCIFVF